LLVLNRELHAGAAANGLSDEFGSMADDHDLVGAAGSRKGIENPFE
jgi:hypothetical protein